MTPGPIAFAALLLLVPLTAVLFTLARPPVALAILYVTAVLVLPERVGFDAPGLPPLDKNSLTSVCALTAAILTAGRSPGRSPWGFWPIALSIAGILGVVLTVLTNAESLRFGATTLPGLRPYDAVGSVGNTVLRVLVPFFLARLLIRTTQDAGALLRVLAVATLLYIPLIALELRMSPQLHRMVYGFHQHSFAQTLRGDGYRPMVFMSHGLALAMFVFSGLIASSTLSLAGVRLPAIRTGPATLVIGAVLLLLKSLSAALYGVLVFPLQRVVSPRLQRWALICLCLVVLSYPAARLTGVFPVERLLAAAASFSGERASSLQVRFDNEDALLARAALKPWFGWGAYGRNRVFDEFGTDVSITDGAWIIVVGDSGVVGFVFVFGLLLQPVLAAIRASTKTNSAKDRVLLLGLCWIVAIGTVDLLPNGLFSSLNHLLAGCLSGFASGIASRRPSNAAGEARGGALPVTR